ncbi:MAG TPA: methyltransferase domain-containing protein [Verrucomicrobiae bacterium]|nr:methyltransferase domain-containing protein [Verrucomicrobiae bacterium]
MGFLNKLGMAIGSSTGLAGTRPLPYSRDTNNGNGGLRAVAANRVPESQETTRISNGLKEFLWNLEGLGRGTLLDLGPAWQTTLNFFIERGFRVTSDDILRDWSEFVKEQESRSTLPLKEEDYLERTPEARTKKFLEENLQYPESSFDALLLWDVLDYLEPAVAKHLVTHLDEMLRPGGVVFAMFHSKKPEGFQRYRVTDTSRLQVLSAKPICTAQKVYQNREIQGLFGNCRTIKTFIGRDQLRETLFLK